ncbi:unnamed protein product [Moneuplotes crassus]|uniref:Uncharacterized protein n=1 Tax=Euplotes crassus TaxID=5936 RepID=A0AAD1UF17_EUPCR|nr:unnamed protein product [Moneuplotes crassus]
MEYLLHCKLDLNPKTSIYILRVKNTDVPKTSGYHFNDEDNPDLAFNVREWTDTIESGFYCDNKDNLMLAVNYIEKKEYAFFFTAESKKQKKRVIQYLEKAARFKIGELEEVKTQDDEFILPARKKQEDGLYYLKTINDTENSKSAQAITQLLKTHITRSMQFNHSWKFVDFRYLIDPKSQDSQKHIHLSLNLTPHCPNLSFPTLSYLLCLSITSKKLIPLKFNFLQKEDLEQTYYAMPKLQPHKFLEAIDEDLYSTTSFSDVPDQSLECSQKEVVMMNIATGVKKKVKKDDVLRRVVELPCRTVRDSLVNLPELISKISKITGSTQIMDYWSKVDFMLKKDRNWRCAPEPEEKDTEMEDDSEVGFQLASSKLKSKSKKNNPDADLGGFQLASNFKPKKVKSLKKPSKENEVEASQEDNKSTQEDSTCSQKTKQSEKLSALEQVLSLIKSTQKELPSLSLTDTKNIAIEIDTYSTYPDFLDEYYQFISTHVQNPDLKVPAKSSFGKILKTSIQTDICWEKL